MNLHIRSVCLALAIGTAPAAPQADNTGDPGRIIFFGHNTPASDEYTLYRGIVVIKPWHQPAQAYRWGGSICPGKDLDLDEQALVERAFLARRVTMQPYFKNGQGGHLCLTGFDLSY